MWQVGVLGGKSGARLPWKKPTVLGLGQLQAEGVSAKVSRCGVNTSRISVGVSSVPSSSTTFGRYRQLVWSVNVGYYSGSRCCCRLVSCPQRVPVT